MSDERQFIRRASLVVLKQATSGGDNYDSRMTAVLPKALDLSEMHFQFSTVNWDEQGPDNCSIRVWNLSEQTVQEIVKHDYTQVILQAGYGAAFGIIFKGDIKQFRIGKASAKDSYLDILAADGDLAYNFAVANTTLSAGQNNRAGLRKAINETMGQYGVTLLEGQGQDEDATGGIVEGLRGKVLFGMARAYLEDMAATQGATWSIQDGKIQMIPLTGYLPGEAVVLTAATGLIGVPEQTQSGIIARCLINPKIRIGGRVQIDNKSINQNLSQENVPGFQVPFNQWAAVQNFASVTADGMYRVYGCEAEGDTRGQAWYQELTLLAIDSSSRNVKPYG